MTEVEDTKTHIVKTADVLLRKNSFNSFSYRDIADEVGIKKASIHYHFQTKSVLGVQVIRNYRQKIEYLIEKLRESTNNPLEKLQAYFEFFRDGLRRDLICPGLVLSVEFNTINKEMQDELKDLFNFYLDWLTNILKEGLENQIFKFDDEPDKLALYVISLVEGALIFSRAYNKKDHFDYVVNKIQSMLTGGN